MISLSVLAPLPKRIVTYTRVVITVLLFITLQLELVPELPLLLLNVSF